MAQQHTYAVIMAGGIGSRFWPMSRNMFPKQFHDMLGRGQTLIQTTYERFRRFVPAENIYIVTNALYKPLIQDQLPEVPDRQVLYEPFGRNTAPCILYAASRIHKNDPHARIIVSPSDHLILPEEDFQRDVQVALDALEGQSRIMTIGINPSRPDTGYGYIQYLEEAGATYFKVKTFTEKPSLEIAKSFLRSGDFVWNSGIFIFSSDTILRAFEALLPDMYELFEEAKPAYETPDEPNAIEAVYSRCKNISIDYGIMEKANNVFVIRSHFRWSDLGTWKSLYEEMSKDTLGNALSGNILAYNSSNNIVKVTPQAGDKLVVLKGIENLIVVDTGDVLLVCPKDQEQTIRNIVADVRKDRGDQFV